MENERMEHLESYLEYDTWDEFVVEGTYNFFSNVNLYFIINQRLSLSIKDFSIIIVLCM